MRYIPREKKVQGDKVDPCLSYRQAWVIDRHGSYTINKGRVLRYIPLTRGGDY